MKLKVSAAIGAVVGILVSVLLVSHFNQATYFKRHRTLEQDRMIELINNDDHFDSMLAGELRDSIREEQNYIAKYAFSWCGGDPEIDFVFTLPPIDCPCGCGQLTPERIVKMDLRQHLDGEWYILKSSVEYAKEGADD